MAKYQYVILTSAMPGKLEEFEQWYDNQHLPDVVRAPGVTAAKRYRLKTRVLTPETTEEPAWNSLAIYEFDTEDPIAVAAHISTLAGTDAMPGSDALDPSRTVKFIAELVSERSRS